MNDVSAFVVNCPNLESLHIALKIVVPGHADADVDSDTTPIHFPYLHTLRMDCSYYNPVKFLRRIHGQTPVLREVEISFFDWRRIDLPRLESIFKLAFSTTTTTTMTGITLGNKSVTLTSLDSNTNTTVTLKVRSNHWDPMGDLDAALISVLSNDKVILDLRGSRLDCSIINEFLPGVSNRVEEFSPSDIRMDLIKLMRLTSRSGEVSLGDDTSPGWIFSNLQTLVLHDFGGTSGTASDHDTEVQIVQTVLKAWSDPNSAALQKLLCDSLDRWVTWRKFRRSLVPS